MGETIMSSIVSRVLSYISSCEVRHRFQYVYKYLFAVMLVSLFFYTQFRQQE